jgi:hypothetical protein
MAGNPVTVVRRRIDRLVERVPCASLEATEEASADV